MADTEKGASVGLKILIRFAVNTGLAAFFRGTFPLFFVLQGGLKPLVLVGIILTILNWLVVPVLHLLSLPIKLFAWIVAFFLVNAAALWLAAEVVNSLAVEGISLTIQGGIVGWLTLSFFLGIGNWFVKSVLK